MYSTFVFCISCHTSITNKIKMSGVFSVELEFVMALAHHFFRRVDFSRPNIQLCKNGFMIKVTDIYC